MRLEPRDRQVLAETFASRVIRRDDLISFGLFGSIGRCNARLLQLRTAGFLKLKTQLNGADLQAPYYSCTALGVRLAAGELNIPAAEAIEIHRAGTRDHTLRHSLSCNDLRSKFRRELGGATKLKLVEWSPELLCRHEFQSSSGKIVTMKPDALAIVNEGGHDRFIFIEVDLGNVSLSKFEEKVDRYRLYACSRAFTDVYGADSFLVLTVTTDERRLSHLAGIASSIDFIFTTWRRLSQGKVVDPIFANGGFDQQHLMSGIHAATGAS